jgi:hypothetical protein
MGTTSLVVPPTLKLRIRNQGDPLPAMRILLSDTMRITDAIEKVATLIPANTDDAIAKSDVAHMSDVSLLGSIV